MKKEYQLKGLRLSSLLLCLILSATLFSTALAAETSKNTQEQHYISPRLQLGLHTKASLDSPIKVLISSGMMVEVLKSEKEFSKIKTEKGVEGWVKSKFITQEEPAIVKVEKMKLALQKAQQLLKERLQAEETNNKTLPDSVVQKEVTEASGQLSSEEKRMYEETIEGLKEEIKAWEQLDRQDKQAQKELAEKHNRLLKEKLAMIASVAIGENVDASRFNLSVKGELPEIQSETQQTFIKTINKNYLLLLMVSGLSFLLGLFVMDVINRRRHGGYRI